MRWRRTSGDLLTRFKFTTSINLPELNPFDLVYGGIHISNTDF